MGKTKGITYKGRVPTIFVLSVSCVDVLIKKVLL